MDNVVLALVVTFLVGFLPPIVLFVLGFNRRKSHPATSKIMYILGVVYLIVSLGICATLMI
ncbi:MAG: hypothetical protein K1X47_14260 [Cyclobacteriaceae bacterium]|nr:hypothetical protein [Cyclobacteriaceae bacterium]